MQQSPYRKTQTRTITYYAALYTRCAILGLRPMIHSTQQRVTYTTHRCMYCSQRKVARDVCHSQFRISCNIGLRRILLHGRPLSLA